MKKNHKICKAAKNLFLEEKLCFLACQAKLGHFIYDENIGQYSNTLAYRSRKADV